MHHRAGNADAVAQLTDGCCPSLLDRASLMPVWNSSDGIVGHAGHGEGPEAQLHAAASFQA